MLLEVKQNPISFEYEVNITSPSSMKSKKSFLTLKDALDHIKAKWKEFEALYGVDNKDEE